MDLTKDTAQYLIGLGRDTRPIVSAPDFSVTGRFYTQQPDGTLEEHHATIPPPGAAFFHTDSFVERIQADREDHQAEAAIFYSPEVITAEFVDENDIRWRHRVDLPLRPVFEELERLQRTRAFMQRDLIRFLRSTLNGHVTESIVERFRALKVTTDGESNAVVAKGREAVDKRIAQKVLEQNGQDIPDEITVTVPVYDLDEVREDLFNVTILVEPTAQDGVPVFELTTVLNSLRYARREALNTLMGHVAQHLETYELDELVHVYNGRA